MAYRGETLKITIKGDSEFDLDSLDFRLMIYPDRHTSNDMMKSLKKDQMTRIGDNHYLAEFTYMQTEDMPLGLYTIEVCVIENKGERTESRSIYAKQGAFPMYDSASKNFG